MNWLPGLVTAPRIQTGFEAFDYDAREKQVASGDQRIAPQAAALGGMLLGTVLVLYIVYARVIGLNRLRLG